MRKKHLVLTDSERYTVEALRKIRNLVRKEMRADDKREYEAHYLCEEEILSAFAHEFCDVCGESSYDSTVNAWDCPCGLDYTDKSCYRWFAYARIKEIIIEEDMVLRVRLGDVFKDDYSEFLKGVYF